MIHRDQNDNIVMLQELQLNNKGRPKAFCREQKPNNGKFRLNEILI